MVVLWVVLFGVLPMGLHRFFSLGRIGCEQNVLALLSSLSQRLFRFKVISMCSMGSLEGDFFCGCLFFALKSLKVLFLVLFLIGFYVRCSVLW